MPHHCKLVVITCEDFRLHQRKDGRNYIAEFIKSLGEDCDLITRAGAVKDLIDCVGTNHESVCRDCDVSVRLHNAETIYLINHEDCGAYNSVYKFASKEEESAKHTADLKEAARILQKRFPTSQIKTYFAELKENSGDEFIIKEIA